MANDRKVWTANTGDVVERMECRCGITLVLSSWAAAWKCGTCKSPGTRRGTITLGEDGAVPAPT